MKKYILKLVATGLVTSVSINPFIVSAKANNINSTSEVKESITLSEEQKSTLSKLFEEKLANEKKILDSYVKYGLLQEDIAAKMYENKKAWINKLIKNEFVLPQNFKSHYGKSIHK